MDVVSTPDETDMTRDELRARWERAEKVNVVFGPRLVGRQFTDVEAQVSIAPGGQSKAWS